MVLMGCLSVSHMEVIFSIFESTCALYSASKEAFFSGVASFWKLVDQSLQISSAVSHGFPSTTRECARVDEVFLCSLISLWKVLESF